ncbi:Hypothetical protein POVN_LOCUS270 [uncultured virus]|nr:Hypothetical protein POVN_LOCUS270 [uncultured virus]
MDATSVLQVLTKRVTDLKTKSNPEETKALLGWLQQGGLVSLQKDLIQTLERYEEEAKLEVFEVHLTSYSEPKLTAYDSVFEVTKADTFGDVRARISALLRIPEVYLSMVFHDDTDKEDIKGQVDFGPTDENFHAVWSKLTSKAVSIELDGEMLCINLIGEPEDRIHIMALPHITIAELDILVEDAYNRQDRDTHGKLEINGRVPPTGHVKVVDYLAHEPRLLDLYKGLNLSSMYHDIRIAVTKRKVLYS